MMSEMETRDEILDLLARGKINIDEAVELLSHSTEAANSAVADDPVYKAELAEDLNSGEVLKIDVADELVAQTLPKGDKETRFDNVKQPEWKNNRLGQPRWLRVQVINNDTGKNKVAVNIPFGMVKFGLGIAQTFSPELKGIDLDDIGEMLSDADSGLLVDVQDDESNEHVRIFFD